MSTAAQAFRKLPRSWAPVDNTQRRFADVGSYDAEARTVKATLSVGAPVSRMYGTEILSIRPGAIDLKRASSGLVPLIDSHQVFGIGNVLGRLASTWFEAGTLAGLLEFDDSDVGRKAEGLVSRGTVRGISIGYRVDEWEVTDDDGAVVPDRERLMWDEDYTFTAKRWELLEVSLCSVPSDPAAMIRSRSLDGSTAIGADGAAEILTRMRCRSRIARRSVR
jgi:phage head maturation protease